MKAAHALLQLALVGGMALAVPPAEAQGWESTGMPLGFSGPTLLFADTLHDALLVSGLTSITYNGHGCFPLMRLKDGAWDTLALFWNAVEAAIIYHDTLIIGGGFHGVWDDSLDLAACYVGGAWRRFGQFQAISGGIKKFRVINGELYALGVFGWVDGAFCNGLAKRVGGHWEPVGGVLPAFWSSPMFFDAVEYQGRLVVAGVFFSTDGTINNIMAYDGTSWQPFCNCMGGGMDGAGCLAIYQGEPLRTDFGRTTEPS